MHIHKISRWVALLSALMLAAGAHAEKRKAARNALEPVLRMAVVSPFFCTDTLKREPNSAARKHYHESLRILEQTIQKRLPVSLGESRRFRIAPPDLTVRALRALGWAPQDLYEYEAALEGKWPVPDPKRAAKLAQKLRVDAVFLAVMREPASTRAGYQLRRDDWNPNPLNLRFERYREHVVSPTVRAFLFSDEGELLWQDEEIAEYPRTRPHTPKTLRVDWLEATLKVAQEITDNLIREAEKSERPAMRAER
jgi:hypothetical protein